MRSITRTTRRMDADRRLTRKHDRIGTLEYRVADVRHLGPCRPWAAHHGIEHLGSRNDDLFPLRLHLVIICFLDDRHVFRRHLNAEVAAGYHDTVRRIDNLVDVGHAFGIFNLGDDGLVSTEVRDELFHRIYMLRPADKRGHDEIDPLFDGKADVLFVGVGQGRQVDGDAPANSHLLRDFKIPPKTTRHSNRSAFTSSTTSSIRPSSRVDRSSGPDGGEQVRISDVDEVRARSILVRRESKPIALV